MSDRTYLSIGDVLTLLRREFPDVTISKIRFLESQGLVDPERTPSGYRKFYEHDVERLRWVLRQQREHFLPLKVIKGRLEGDSRARVPNGAAHDEPTADRAEHPARAPSSSGTTPAQLGLGRAEKSSVRSPVLLEDHFARGAVPTRGTSPVQAATGRREPAEAVMRGRAVQDAELPGLEGTEADVEGVGARGVGARAVGAAQAGAVQAGAAQVGADEVASGAGRAQRPDLEVPARTAVKGHRTSRTTGVPPAEAAAGEATESSSIGPLEGSSVTLEELSRECGLSTAEIQKLESFGLVTGRAAGGTVYYDEGALAVAKLASSFASFGVEARHLRMHLLAAQREAGFVEQVVLPLLKQRNPASRQRAQETVSELSRLGQELHAVLLRRSIRELLGG